MAFKTFVIPLHGSEQAEAELNGFLRKHKVLAVERRWVDQGTSSFWSFCVDYLDHAPAVAAPAAAAGQSPSQRGRVDYRDKLPPEQFEVFSKLRDLRKEIALAEQIPLYAVFKNEQLYQMVEKKACSKADLEAISGVGDARVAKYGPRFLELLTQLQGAEQRQGAEHEADGKPV